MNSTKFLKGIGYTLVGASTVATFSSPIVAHCVGKKEIAALEKTLNDYCDERCKELSKEEIIKVKTDFFYPLKGMITVLKELSQDSNAGPDCIATNAYQMVLNELITKTNLDKMYEKFAQDEKYAESMQKSMFAFKMYCRFVTDKTTANRARLGCWNLKSWLKHNHLDFKLADWDYATALKIWALRMKKRYVEKEPAATDGILALLDLRYVLCTMVQKGLGIELSSNKQIDYKNFVIPEREYLELLTIETINYKKISKKVSPTVMHNILKLLPITNSTEHTHHILDALDPEKKCNPLTYIGTGHSGCYETNYMKCCIDESCFKNK